MYVEIIYHKPELSGYAGARYTFHTDLPLVVGQKVLVPSNDGEPKKALVMAVGIDESKIKGQPWAKNIKSITQLDTE